MIKKNMTSKDPDILGTLPALRRAAKRALQIGIETGTPVYVLKHGKIVDIAGQKKRRKKIKVSRKRKS
jgi:DNA-directed RNA polymerase subunit K/omega